MRMHERRAAETVNVSNASSWNAKNPINLLSHCRCMRFIVSMCSTHGNDCVHRSRRCFVRAIQDRDYVSQRVSIMSRTSKKNDNDHRCRIDMNAMKNRSSTGRKIIGNFFSQSPVSRSITALNGLNVVHHHRCDEQGIEFHAVCDAPKCESNSNDRAQRMRLHQTAGTSIHADQVLSDMATIERVDR